MSSNHANDRPPVPAQGLGPDDLERMPIDLREVALRRKLSELEQRLLSLHGALARLRATLH